MDPKKLIIVRGASGSGKSTIAAKLGENVYEADDYFIDEFGKYCFDASKIGQAHMACRAIVEHGMELGENPIIVSNTSTQLWELKPYQEMAKKYGYTVEYIRTPGPWDPIALSARNIHKVPRNTIEKQITRYQPIEGEQEWKN